MSEEKQIFTLKQVALSIQKTMDERYRQLYWVKAEMFKLNQTSKGHCFPELVHKEDGKVTCEMRGTIWATNFQRVAKKFADVVKEPLRDGLNLLLQVKISFHPIYGLSLEIVDIDPSFSLGELQKEREESILRLKKDGVFSDNRILAFPFLPKRLAIISIETSKGFSDFRTLIAQNQWGYKFVYHLFPSILNGDGAVESILNQLKKIAKKSDEFDCVLIIRGGGGEIGLSCYNNYDLSFAIATFPIPVLTGIGHSTNLTVSELVAHRSAITPSELADFLLESYRAIDLTLSENSLRLSKNVRQLLQVEKSFLGELVQDFRFASIQTVKNEQQKLKTAAQFLHSQSERFLMKNEHFLRQFRQELLGIQKIFHLRQEERIRFMLQGLERGIQHHLKDKKQYISDTQDFISGSALKKVENNLDLLQRFEKTVDLVNPENVLKRGFAMVLNEENKLVDFTKTKAGDELRIKTYTHQLKTKVLNIERNG